MCGKLRPRLNTRAIVAEGKAVRVTQEHPDDAANRQTQSLAGLALTLLLIVASLYLVRTIRAQSEVQDCLLSGRVACTTLASL